jgi:CxxC-x17-CxxC domain-containing protein
VGGKQPWSESSSRRVWGQRPGQLSRSKLKKSEGIFLMDFQDKTLVCKDCGADFIFTAGEQEFYAEKGFQNEPARCRDCRNSRKRQRNEGAGNGGTREMFEAVCASCGITTQVPFKPRLNRPVYCRDCFQNMND